MPSENKKKKAKNSYMYNGGMKPDGLKLKRIQYYTKQDRLIAKRQIIKEDNYNG